MSVADPDLRAALDAVDAKALSLPDPRYPALLRTIKDPPQTLYVRGDVELLSKPQLAIVGARRATAMGLKLAEEIAGAATRAGLGVCSGLALGIDGAAHRGALIAGGSTVAVMATGVERIYPHRHSGLGEEIAAAGCVVTEFPPGTPPLPHNFPRRNRIISGLSLGVLVVEAALPSGSLITANIAAEQGREVFALPWSVAHKGGTGCLHLLRDGAKMVQGIEDILEELDSLYGLQLSLLERPRTGPADTGARSDLLALLGYEAVSVDQLSAASGISSADILPELSRLELQGLVDRCPGGYIRTR
ncbi:DNA-processing protein DprA [Pseudohalioglobus lutimaris]|uniref:DNA-protecting protein DprA n=1 Tax=Pseudohalioglobus lutimaris TaxID=1737061 RepID=A0A2N5X8S1_9GAMM|nr:DNA-processing protein DprA [Pseudohalioglobus lutimaris]PLW70868.1 DNA-protecting protein DprA [Pseudohalioglobus lutimaris]